MQKLRAPTNIGAIRARARRSMKSINRRRFTLAFVILLKIQVIGYVLRVMDTHFNQLLLNRCESRYRTGFKRMIPRRRVIGVHL